MVSISICIQYSNLNCIHCKLNWILQSRHVSLDACHIFHRSRGWHEHVGCVQGNGVASYSHIYPPIHPSTWPVYGAKTMPMVVTWGWITVVWGRVGVCLGWYWSRAGVRIHTMRQCGAYAQNQGAVIEPVLRTGSITGAVIEPVMMTGSITRE